MAVYRFLLTEDVPDIEGQAGDVLVWEYPRVSLYRQVRLGEQITLLKLMPQHWVYVILKYDDRFSPLDDETPYAAELLGQLPTRHQPSPGEHVPDLQLRLLA